MVTHSTVLLFCYFTGRFPHTRLVHYSDVIMDTMASQITSLTTVYLTVYSVQIKENIKLCVIGLCVGIYRRPVNSPHKLPVTRKIFPFDDVIMVITCQNARILVWRFVCLSGWKITHNPRTYWHIFTKFGTQMHFGLVQNHIYFQTYHTNILAKLLICASPHLSECIFIFVVSLKNTLIFSGFLTPLHSFDITVMSHNFYMVLLGYKQLTEPILPYFNRIKLQWNLNKHMTFIKQNAFENFACKM